MTMRPAPTAAFARSILLSTALLSALPAALPATPVFALPPAPAAPAARAAASAPAGGGWIAASYEALLDSRQIVRSGERLATARRDPQERPALQPLLAPYSRLLPAMLQMAAGSASPVSSAPSALPFRDVAERYPPGAEQPGWAAILREGRFLLTADGAGRARIFLPGDSPRRAYEREYGWLRLPLATLLPADGSPLAVEVYAYGNDYANAELALLTGHYAFKAASFPTRKERPDLAALEGFFARGLSPEGGRLERGRGLVLYGRRPDAPERPGPTLAGAPIALTDLAVAYRAAFFAGDNTAFVSLDPDTDVTRVRVNFGGLLEDTRLGTVLLEADKRFKTLAAGVTPEGDLDQRAAIAREVPGFLDAGSRELAMPDTPGRRGWIGTRLWFYPDSVRVETDPARTVARVANPRLLADAERPRDEFMSASEFVRERKSRLSPSIRATVADLNARYPLYAQAFPPLAELEQVGRLMALAAWLRKADTLWLDLESLLALTLPPAPTERVRNRLLTVSAVSYLGTSAPKPAGVVALSAVAVLDPLLDSPLERLFPDQDSFLRAWPGRDAAGFAYWRGRPLRELVRTEEELRMVVDRAAPRVAAPPPPEMRELAGRLEISREEIRRLEAEAVSLGAPAGTAVGDTAPRAETLAIARREAGEQRDRTVARMRALAISRRTVSQINGGINLDPANIRMESREMNAALREMLEGEGWVGSDSFSADAAPVPAGDRPAARPRRPPAPAPAAPVPGREKKPAPASPARERIRLAPARLTVTGLPPAVMSGAVEGRVDAGGRIVFTPSSLAP
jgi:hypothetical protein